VSQATQAVLFNAVPLLLMAALYAAVTVLVVPDAWRDRGDASPLDLAQLLVFPLLAVAAAILGADQLVERDPFGNIWVSFAAIVVATLPAVGVLLRGGTVLGLGRARKAERRASSRERQLAALETISRKLASADDAEAIARALLDEIAELMEVEFVGLALVDDEAGQAQGLLARREGQDFDLWRSVRFDLAREASGIATAVFEGAPVSFSDAGRPPIDQRVAEAVGAQSAAFVPLVAGERVIAVLAVASIGRPRAFSVEELGPIRTVAAEAALALERARSASALADALERERLMSAIARRVRSELDLETVQRVAVEEIGVGLGLQRCFIRLLTPGEEPTIAAEWVAEGASSIAAAAGGLPVTALAARHRETVAVGDVASDARLADAGLQKREVLLRLGTKAALATPLVVFDRMIGTLTLHRASPSAWLPEELALAEAVARELGLAIHTAALLRENTIRLEQQTALLKAARVLTGELRLETVLQLLVDEAMTLFGGDAADCYLYDPARASLRCAAVHGFDPSVVGFEFTADEGVFGRAVEHGTPQLTQSGSELRTPVRHEAYRGIVRSLVAPMTWSDEILGVIGVGSRDPDRVFTRSDLDLLAAFASLASLALRNAELFEQRERQAGIEHAFAGVADALGRPVSLEEAHAAVAQAAAAALGGSGAVVLMPRPEGGLALAAAGGLSQGLEARLAESLAERGGALEQAAGAGRILASSGLADDDRFAPQARELARSHGIEALLAIPVTAPREEGGGLVVVLLAEPRRFADDDIELALQLSSTARGALERSELFETERRGRALSQRLARIGSLLAAQLDPGALLGEVAAQAVTLLAADACAVLTLEDAGFAVTALAGQGTEPLQGSRLPHALRPAADVVHGRAPVALVEVAGGDDPGPRDPLLGAGFQAYLGVPLVGGDGDPTGVLSIYSRRSRTWRDEEVDALGALAASASAAVANAELYQRVALERERSVAILRNVAEGIVAVDGEGRVVLWNEAAERITGVPSAEAVGRTTEQALRRSLEQDGRGPASRLVSIRRGAEEVWLSLSEAVMRDAAGQVAGRVFAFRDISAERSVDQLKSEFVSTVSHGLRTPLTSIYGFAATLLREDVDFSDEERRTFLSYIASEAERLTAIVDQLLSVARLESGDLALQAEATDVRDVVAEVVAGAEPESANGHRLVVDLPADPVEAEIDREKLRQVLASLVDNAIKFSPAGSAVTVSVARTRDRLELRVRDEGEGIAEAERERIFAKFYRGDSALREGALGGAGLGLFIVQGLVGAMGGSVSVAASEEGGSSFVVELPVRARAAPEGKT
jgi:PAS domain S-box-containing protein